MASGSTNRIGTKVLNAGPGFGGSCIPKDVRARANTAGEHGRPLRLIDATIEVNETPKQAMATKVINICAGEIAGNAD